jgi:hypothetical protein
LSANDQRTPAAAGFPPNPLDLPERKQRTDDERRQRQQEER